MGLINQREKNGLNIIIVGCGKVGSTLTEQLINEGHDITIIDTNSMKIQELTNLYDVMGIVGNGASYTVQKEAGIDDADLLIAVTESDELNMLCCTVAKRVGDCAAIARVRTPDYSQEVGYLREKLGLAMIINPELEAAIEAARILYLPSALEVNSFAHGQAELIKFKLPADSALNGKALYNLGHDKTQSILICAVEREGEVIIPSGNFVLQEGDIVSIIANRRQIKKFLDYIGVKSKSVRNSMIIGGGKAAYYLANQLIHMGISVKLIERDRSRCEELSVLLPKAIIINGDGTDEEVLKEEGIENIDSFIPLTGIDEENIMLTLHAKQVSNAKIITKINRINFTHVIDSLDLGSVIYPKYITSEAIIAYVRAMKNTHGNSNIVTLYHLFNHRVEALEFKVSTESEELTDIPLKDLTLKKDILVSCINRGGKIIIPSGQDCIQKGDTVIIVTTHSGLKDITDILK